MDRLIAFRAKDFAGNWVYGFPVLGEHATMNFTKQVGEVNECVSVFVDPNTICQAIGMADRDGKFIYEGDIVSMLDYQGDMEGGHAITGEVFWNKERLQFMFRFPDECCGLEDLDLYPLATKVIGNIFDKEKAV